MAGTLGLGRGREQMGDRAPQSSTGGGSVSRERGGL